MGVGEGEKEEEKCDSGDACYGTFFPIKGNIIDNNNMECLYQLK